MDLVIQGNSLTSDRFPFLRQNNPIEIDIIWAIAVIASIERILVPSNKTAKVAAAETAKKL